MAKHGKILVVDDNHGILEAVELLLTQYFEQVITTDNPEKTDDLISKYGTDVVLLDMNFKASVNTGNEGLYFLGRIKDKYPDVQVVVFTAYADLDLAVDALKRGANDFVVKPWDNDKLVATLQSAYNLRQSRKEIKKLKEINQTLSSSTSRMYWGNSPIMNRLHDTVRKVAATDANVLITGENGTGKEVLAREIHLLSSRSNEPMVTVDMGAVVETLFESELFGHVKGAFTDAKNDRAGKFEAAAGGTLFLDEIGNLPMHLQSKLLTVIQRGVVTRVGSNQETEINVRLICATNKDIEKMVDEGIFREDLLYRINTIHLSLPALRDRADDIVPFAEKYLEHYSRKYSKNIEGFTADAKREMTDYPWNGNIRELQHTIEKAVILCDDHHISSKALMLRPVKSRKQEVLTIEQMECRMIKDAMADHNGNMSAVAEQLGISRPTLYSKIKKYNL
ncbi:MAG: sigma-54 dependent transcriptional regulator [Bacteroidales bacterium]|nr:sigma-54 dependent transcriptional regulator [Bacteroidales bacterium]MDD4670474.1 sigma-54 dependent transcriptional regulator [Bacteroidales bacterium]